MLMSDWSQVLCICSPLSHCNISGKMRVYRSGCVHAMQAWSALYALVPFVWPGENKNTVVLRRLEMWIFLLSQANCSAVCWERKQSETTWNNPKTQEIKGVRTHTFSIVSSCVRTSVNTIECKSYWAKVRKPGEDVRIPHTEARLGCDGN